MADARGEHQSDQAVGSGTIKSRRPIQPCEHRITESTGNSNYNAALLKLKSACAPVIRPELCGSKMIDDGPMTPLEPRTELGTNSIAGRTVFRIRHTPQVGFSYV
jgi:hypothetical protein